MEKNVEKVKKNENKVTCKDCGISYDNETILEGHIERKHLKIGRRRKLKCKECKHQFIWSKFLGSIKIIGD